MVLGVVSHHIQLETGLKLVIFCRNDVVLNDWLKEHDFLSCNIFEDKISMRHALIMFILFGCLFVLFDLILYVPSTLFQLNRDGSSWVEPLLSWDKCVLLKDHNAVMPVRLEPAAPRS